jgi:acetyltransferase-like isoleucine patch superfamily enzyme
MSIKEFGLYSYGKENITVHYGGHGYNVYIGNFCSIALNLNIYVGGNHRTDWITTYPFGYLHLSVFNTIDAKEHDHSKVTKGNVIIGNDVWIGNNVTIMSGVTIGDGAVIANNSHVVKNVPAYTIVGGNPAKHIRKRFSDEQIESLVNIKWWNWPVEKINENAKLLCSEKNIDEFIKIHT